MSALSRGPRWFGLVCLLVACDGETPPGDAGDEPDAGAVDAGRDGGELDTLAPRVTSTRPRDGAELVARVTSLEVRFSEPIVATRGSITARSDGETIALGDLSFEPEGDVVRVAPPGGWPGGARVEVRVEAFEDAAGNAQVGAHELVFFTSDEGAPAVVESTPAEGATVEATLEQIAIRFDEPMNPVLGALRLEGGPGQLGARAWSSTRELRVAVAGLQAGTEYRVVLSDFEDTSGNALDPAPVLGDGALDFTTTPDTAAPTVVSSNPTHEQLDVDVGALRTIEVTFSEPMDTSVRTATLATDTTSAALIGNWSLDATTLTFDVVGRVTVDAENRLDLSAMRDRAGNALSPDVSLSGGELVFTTSSADEALPFVVFSTPVEGADQVSPRLAALDVLFSEAMDTSRAAIELVSSGETRMLEGTWNAAGTRLTVPTGGLGPRASFTIDLRGFTDATGNALDAAHPYLADGVLDFRTGEATGESCTDALTAADATHDGSALVFELEPARFQSVDGGLSCSYYTDILDGVIAYEKVSGDVASGGRALRITATSPDPFNGVQLEIFRDVCDPGAVGGGAAAREVCLGSRLQWVQYLDVPAGTYYVWVGGERGRVCSSSPPFTCSSYAFPGATVRIEEVDIVPEGDSCTLPFDSTSSIYSSPATDEHVWVIPHGATTSVDYGTSTYGEGTIRCFTRQGPDSVTRIVKARSSSLLDIEIDPFPADSFSATDPGGWSLDRAGVIAELVDGCDALASRSLTCTGRINTSRSFQATGEAGSYYLWLTATNSEVDHLRTTVRVREVDPAPGESCQSAIVITPGTTNAVTPSSSAAYFPPSCVPATDGITWYRFTPTRELSVVSVEGAGAVALVDAASGEPLGCLSDAATFGLPVRGAPGRDVCVAVPSSTGVTGIAVRELDWRGVEGTATDLGIGRPVSDTGTELAITTESFLVITPTQLYMGINPNSTSTTTSAPALVTAPRSGGVVADRILVDRFSIGSSAVTTGEALFSADETASRANRLFRLIDATGSPSTTVWDTGSAYESPAIHAMGQVAGTDTLLLANRGTTTVPTTFYSATMTTPAAVTRLGQNAALRDVVAIESDGTWIYLVGATGPSTATIRTVYRLPLADVTAAPEPLAPAQLVGFSTTQGSMALDVTRDILYFRSTSVPRGVHAIFDVSTAAPVYVGPVFERGGSADHGLALDPAVPALFLFETETQTTGTFVEVR